GGAFNYVKFLNSINYLGPNDWRVPEIEELVSLCNKGGSTATASSTYCNGTAVNAGKWLEYQGFINVKQYYWSSGEVPAEIFGNPKDKVVIVIMNDGQIAISSKKCDYCYVWPVR
ncbi:protein containing DUF1566, partial [Candidatus Magnetobacterium bavaricum]